jgi:DNA repair photolyase
MPRFTVREIMCKSVINRVHGMPFAWSINPYRGCRHACVYCYARPTHEYLGMNSAEEFQEVIFAKVNAPQVVRQELARRSWRGDTVAIGTATDPYQQAESHYQITRGILVAFRDFRNPLSLTTKSPMILRDLDILRELAHYAAVTVHFTVTTLDETLWRKIEPTTAKPRKRLEAMWTLREHGIRAGILLSPILPGLTDDTEHLEAVIAAAAEYGADFVWAGVLRLGHGISEYYLPFLQREYPELAERYIHLYHRNYAPAAYNDMIHARVSFLKQRYGLLRERATATERATPPTAPIQLTLFRSRSVL